MLPYSENIDTAIQCSLQLAPALIGCGSVTFLSQNASSCSQNGINRHFRAVLLRQFTGCCVSLASHLGEEMRVDESEGRS